MNENKLDLFNNFMFHLNNYSIAQVLQKILSVYSHVENESVEHIVPSSDGIHYGYNGALVRCNWSLDTEILTLLLNKTLVEIKLTENYEAIQNICEILINAINQSNKESFFIKNFLENINFKLLINISLESIEKMKNTDNSSNVMILSILV